MLNPTQRNPLRETTTITQDNLGESSPTPTPGGSRNLPRGKMILVLLLLLRPVGLSRPKHRLHANTQPHTPATHTHTRRRGWIIRNTRADMGPHTKLTATKRSTSAAHAAHRPTSHQRLAWIQPPLLRTLSLSLSCLALYCSLSQENTLTLRSGCATSGRTHITGRIRWRNRMLPTRQPQQLAPTLVPSGTTRLLFPFPGFSSLSRQRGFCCSSGVVMLKYRL